MEKLRIFSCTIQLVALPIFRQKQYFLDSNLSCSGHSCLLFTPYHCRTEECCLMISFIFMPHISHVYELVSNWILTYCQLTALGSLQTIKLSRANSHFKSHHIYKPLLKSIHNTYAYAYTQILNTNFQRVSPFSTTPVKRARMTTLFMTSLI